MRISLNTVGIFATVGALIVILRSIFRTRVPKGLSLPPGPPGRFLIGNARDVPSHHEWETYSEWHKKYGDLVYLNVFGTSLLYINSAEMAYELFERRSAIYSDRPHIPMLDLTGVNWTFAFFPYGDRWRQYRHIFSQNFNTTVQTKFAPVQVEQSRKLLKQLLKSSDNWEQSVRQAIGATIMEIAYGISVLPENDPYIAGLERIGKVVGAITLPGAYLVNVIPQLKHLPEWFPGAGFLKEARIWKEELESVSVLPFQFVKKELAAGRAKPSLTASFLEEAYAKSKDQTVSEAEEEWIRHMGATVFVGGSDTTISTVAIFIFAMILHPQVQLKAQKELDAVVGPDRLPSFEDRRNLPYVNALCKEVLRWNPLMPLAFPHRLMKDDIVGKYFIPAGTMVMGNAWGMLHSETTYGADTDSFKPERFLHSPDMPEPVAGFGFGRRACAGRTMADNALFAVAVSILHVFNIVPPSGGTPPDRNAIVPGLLAHPMPFECNFVPRSKGAEGLINQID